MRNQSIDGYCNSASISIIGKPGLSYNVLMPISTETPTLQINQLWTQFGNTVIHQDLNLTIMPGEIVGIIGGSGTGKTVLLRQMLGLNRPSRGTIHVFGNDIHHPTKRHFLAAPQRWGVLFQMGALFSAMTTLENVAAPLRECGALPDALVQAVALLKLHLVGIAPEHANKYPADLSGGMIKRVALARALALDPELLFLDEPTAGLDPASSVAFVKLIRNLHQHMPLTVIMITHDLESLLALSTKIAVLAEKRVLIYDTPEAVIRYPHPFIEQFFQFLPHRPS